MDYLADDNFNAYQQDDDTPEYTHTDADAHNISSPEQLPEQLSKREKVKAKLKSGRWRGLSAFSSSTAVQDKLLEKSVSDLVMLEMRSLVISNQERNAQQTHILRHAHPRPSPQRRWHPRP